MDRIYSFLPPSLVLFLRLTRPFFLLGGILMYALGVGIANYLGATIDWGVYWLGQGCVTMLQLSAQYLNEYFDRQADLENPNRTPFSGGSGVDALPRRTALLAAVSSLTIGTVITVLLYAGGRLSPPAVVVLGAAFIGSLAYSVPPFRLAGSGYGELTASILVANLVPAFSLILQTGELHRFLFLLTFPLTFLHLAMLMAFSLPDYANDIKFGKRTLMVRLGWQRGMILHNVVIAAAYLFFVFDLLQGVTWQLIWPAFLTLPIGIYQIRHMNQIASGGRTRWTLLTFSAIVLFGLTAYFLTLTIWIR